MGKVLGIIYRAIATHRCEQNGDIDKTPWRFGVQHWHCAEQPDPFGPDYQFRLQVSPVVPLPW
jgi:hypothetical protein